MWDFQSDRPPRAKQEFTQLIRRIFVCFPFQPVDGAVVKHLYFKSTSSTIYLNENVLWLVGTDITILIRMKVSLYKIWCFHGGVIVLTSWSWHDVVWHVPKFRRNVRTSVCPSTRGATNWSSTWWEETQENPQTGKSLGPDMNQEPREHEVSCRSQLSVLRSSYAGRRLCQRVSRQAGWERIVSICT